MSKMVFSRTGKPYDKVPKANVLVTHFENESIMVYRGVDTQEYYFWGIGIVDEISKGKDWDLLMVRFGGKKNQRKVWVKNTFARKQIYTCKHGQLAQFFGVIYKKVINKRVKYTFVANGIQGWYVPKMLDVNSYEEDLQTVKEEEMEDLKDFIDSL